MLSCDWLVAETSVLASGQVWARSVEIYQLRKWLAAYGKTFPPTRTEKLMFCNPFPTWCAWWLPVATTGYLAAPEPEPASGVACLVKVPGASEVKCLCTDGPAVHGYLGSNPEQ